MHKFLSTVLLSLSLMASSAQVDDFYLVKDRVVAELMKTEIDDAQVQAIMDRMQSDGSFADIDYGDLSRRAGFPHRRHTYDLVYLAKAYKNEDSKYFKNGSVKEKIITGLEYWVAHDFFGDNWHNNQISTPTNLVNLMLVIGDELSQDLVDKAQPMIGRAHMHASGARPSGDRIVIAGILAKNLLFINDRERFEEIIRLIEGEVKFSTGQRGMQHDYSFHHRVDRVNNTISYGYGKYANAFGEWSYYVANTRYAFSIDKINHLVDYYLDGIYKQLVYGVYTDISVKNRSISHKATFEPRGVLEVERLIFGTDYRKSELEEIIKLRKGELVPTKSFCKFFWQTEHFVFQRPDFYTTVRMYSTRNRNMEVPYNGPGKTTHHRADGTNYHMRRGDEYHNIWPVYDWQKISGTTIMQKPALHGIENIQMDGLTDFVGAVTDGMHGAVAFDFRSPHDMVKARKSWFFFEDEYVCLGTDIYSRPNLPVFTTIDQALLRTDVIISQEGEVKDLPHGSHELANVAWILHDSVGYILPQSPKIMISNQQEQGRWSDITDQKNISDELVNMEVFTAGFDHGQRPQNASYQYIVVPNTSIDELQSTSGDLREVDIISNTSDIHAVKSSKLDMCQIAFYKAGEVLIVPQLRLRLASQGMVMTKLRNDRIYEMTVADPSRKLDKMMITLTGKYRCNEQHVLATPDTDGRSTILIIDLPKGVYSGKSITFPIE